MLQGPGEPVKEELEGLLIRDVDADWTGKLASSALRRRPVSSAKSASSICLLPPSNALLGISTLLKSPTERIVPSELIMVRPSIPQASGGGDEKSRVYIHYVLFSDFFRIINRALSLGCYFIPVSLSAKYL
ncbi:hypothetical protein R1flu_018225 [Riccia fluitans]|uniref:Uncharacterized protein n=1 Tax=Riccia fluitans TaxID=41844 RepID=A0ABD1ZFF4_9MARC